MLSSAVAEAWRRFLIVFDGIQLDPAPAVQSAAKNHHAEKGFAFIHLPAPIRYTLELKYLILRLGISLKALSSPNI